MSARQKQQGFRLSVKKAIDAVAALKSQISTPQGQEQLLRKGILLNSYLLKLEAYDNEVLETISDETELELEISSARAFNERVEEAIAECQPLPSLAQGPNPASSGGTGQGAAGGVVQLRVHLPKLEIPPFEGDPIRWQEFWDAFKSAIHDRPDLASVDKFTYLRGLLGGEALRLVEGFRVTEANYREVVDVLTQRYGDKQAVIFAHIDALLSLQPAAGDAASLVNTHVKLERHLRSLDSLQPDQDMILYSVILSKLPRFLKIEAHRKKGSQATWSLTELRQWLGEEIRAREMGERLHRLNLGDHDGATPPHRGRGASHGNSSTSKGSSSASALLSEAKDVHCPFCNGNHLAETCTVYPDSESRRAQLRDRCFICLWRGHIAKSCRRKKPCKFCKRMGHHSCFCFAKFGKPRLKPPSGRNEFPHTSASGEESHRDSSAGSPGTDSSVLLTSNGKQERTIMQTALVQIVNEKGTLNGTARLFFDTGASRSFITERKRRELQLPTASRELLSVSSFQSSRRQTNEHKMVEFGIRCRDGTAQTVVAAVVPTITCPILKVPLNPQGLAVPAWSLAEPMIQSSEYVDIDVLIGMDYYYSFVASERVRGGENLWFLSSKVGFLASGRVSTTEPGAETVAVMLIKTLSAPCATEPPITDLSKYWELEEIGMKEDQKQGVADEEAVSDFCSTAKFEDGRYQVCWPWKTPTLELKDNYGLAFGRLRSLLNRLKKTHSALQPYEAVFRAQLEAGIIEEAPAVPTGDVIYYMPHHCVLKSDHATTKLRVVFDASSKVTKDVASLNDCLYRGPVMLEDLCGLLLRFRSHSIALVSDIEKAFLQIGLQQSQRDCTRFLWVRDTTRPPHGDNLVVYRFCRVPFGVISSPFLLAATVSHHLKQSGSSVAKQILRDIYVDNVITGEASPSEAIQHYQQAKQVFANASMNLREWHSNSQAVLDAIPEQDKGTQLVPKVLGLRWNTQRDTLQLSPVNQVDFQSPITKRSILKALPQVFDPCGFLAPVVVTGKLLLQDLWSLGIGWDEPVPQNVVDTWHRKILPNLARVSEVTIPRYIGYSNVRSSQLHVFCDASSRACACAIYLRQEAPTLEVKVNLLMAKSRLAPLKQKITTPRLELVAVVLGTRLLEFVAKYLTLDIESRFIWTDSQCVLHWLLKDQVATRFIENRLKELRKRTNVQFSYVPTAQNPADLPTRGCTVQTLRSSSTWWHGPEWLQSSRDDWPTFPVPQEPEIAAPMLDESVIKVTGEANRVLPIDSERYSSLNRLLRVTAYVQRFVGNAQKTASKRSLSHILQEEVRNAMKWWITVIQQDFFPEYLAPVGAWPKGKAQTLGIFRDQDGILRCSGRIQLSDLSYDEKHPILLPKSGRFTELVVQSYHAKVMHTGVAGTLARIRQQFWIIKGRSTVKRVIRKCRVCLRFDGGPFKTPPVPPIPEFRLEQAPAFTNTGLDYLGPLFVRQRTGESTKVWILLFTCAVTRAVHLEVTEDMTTDQFLLALRRFIAVYGPPSALVSDNGKQFHTASKLFQRWWTDLRNSSEFQSLALPQGMQWRFIPEMAPWMGGFYERLVGVVKQALRKSLSGVQVTLTELKTVTAEIVAVVNSRPLVYIEEDVGSLPISPGHLIAPSRREGLLLAPPSYDKDYNIPLTTEDLTARWRRLQGMVTNFWKAWRAQYLLSLRERHVSHGQRGTSPWSPQVGAVVQLKQDLPRASWRLGRITLLHSSSDGNVRSATVRLANGRCVRRPLKLLCPLELDVTQHDGNHAPASSTTTTRNLRRAAAVKARQTWQQAAAAPKSDSD